MNENLKPARLVPPGAILKRELEARGWSQRDLADIMKRPTQAISEIVQGAKQLTPETALELAAALGTSAELWTNLESRYRLQLAQRKQAKSGATDRIARKARLYALAPVKELLKRGWIKKVTSLDALEKEVCRFLGLESLDQEPRLAASWRHSQARTPQSGPQLAWVKRVEAVARKQPVGQFSRSKLEQALPSLLKLTASPADIPEALSLLRSMGVRVVIEKHLPHSHIDGVAFTLEDGSPVIGLGLRFDRIDSFWFTLLHELAHIVDGHKGAHLDDLSGASEGEVDSTEQEANRRAQEWLFPKALVDRFVQQWRGRISRDVIVRFASEHGRHPGLLVGQLHHRKDVPYQNFRALLVKVSPHL